MLCTKAEEETVTRNGMKVRKNDVTVTLTSLWQNHIEYVDSIIIIIVVESLPKPKPEEAIVGARVKANFILEHHFLEVA